MLENHERIDSLFRIILDILVVNVMGLSFDSMSKASRSGLM